MLNDNKKVSNAFMATRNTEKSKEANSLVSEHNHRARQKGLEVPAWNATIWRYVDLPKLLYMLVNKSLPLIRVDKFEDKWEGFSAPLSDDEYRGFFRKTQMETDLERFKIGEQLRKFFYASCWHLNDIESDAMWKLYLNGNEGLAIRTTYQSLIFSLREASEEFLIGKVRYTKPSPGLSMLLTCMTKREPFVHERELRVILHDADAENVYRNNSSNILNKSVVQPSVKKLRCDVNRLIEELRISPKANDWFKFAVSDLLEKYKLKDIKLIQSKLSGEPPWPEKIE